MSQLEKPDRSAQYDQLRKLMAGARKVRNLSQREVAEKFGRPQSYLGKFENGKRNLDVVEFIEVAKAIGVDPKRIIARLLKGWPDPATPESAPQAEDPKDST
jgi:transcriptional regulator with XRE-family HTH domain